MGGSAHGVATYADGARFVVFCHTLLKMRKMARNSDDGVQIDYHAYDGDICGSVVALQAAGQGFKVLLLRAIDPASCLAVSGISLPLTSSYLRKLKRLSWSVIWAHMEAAPQASECDH